MNDSRKEQGINKHECFKEETRRKQGVEGWRGGGGWVDNKPFAVFDRRDKSQSKGSKFALKFALQKLCNNLKRITQSLILTLGREKGRDFEKGRECRGIEEKEREKGERERTETEGRNRQEKGGT